MRQIDFEKLVHFIRHIFNAIHIPSVCPTTLRLPSVERKTYLYHLNTLKETRMFEIKNVTRVLDFIYVLE